MKHANMGSGGRKEWASTTVFPASPLIAPHVSCISRSRPIFSTRSRPRSMAKSSSVASRCRSLRNCVSEAEPSLTSRNALATWSGSGSSTPLGALGSVIVQRENMPIEVALSAEDRMKACRHLLLRSSTFVLPPLGSRYRSLKKRLNQNRQILGGRRSLEVPPVPANLAARPEILAGVRQDQDEGRTQVPVQFKPGERLAGAGDATPHVRKQNVNAPSHLARRGLRRRRAGVQSPA